ncbi:unnamed protein product [Durusdinium trenchii]|uniref:Extended synaptotagmin-3 (E-Syt3) n=2 Tax=Durusdinium trenchii TaxID=1381693 RepID=A0ABP0SFG1_9DINO
MKPSLGRLPSRAESFADLDNLSWLNVLFSWLWPNLNRALVQFVNHELTPRLQQSLPSFFRNVTFSRFTLGSKSPELGPVQVTRGKERVDIVLDMKYFSDVDVSVDTGNGLCFGMRQLSCSGKVCISFQPIMPQFPIVGGAQVFFPRVPELDMEFTGLAALGHFPGIEQTIRDSVKEALRGHLVLPRIKAIVLSPEVDPLQAMVRRPLGVLHVRVLRARDLAGVNCHAFEEGSFTSHPYCVLSLGDTSFKTSTVHNTTQPEWRDEPGGYLVVHHREQHLDIEVLAEASGSLLSHNFTGFLGRVSHRLGHMRRWREAGGARRHSLVLDTSQVNCELLHVDDPVNQGSASTLELEVRWFDMVSPSHELAVSQVLIALDLLKGRGFPTGTGLRWRTWIDDFEACVKVSKKGRTHGNQLQFPQVAINPRLFPVIDNLHSRGYKLKDIVFILGIAEELVQSYIRAREDFNHRQEQLLQAQSKEDYRVELQWFENIVHMVDGRDLSKKLHIALYDDQDVEVGQLEPVCLRSLLQCPAKAGAWSCELQVGTDRGLMGWLLPSGPSRFATVDMDISLTVCGLQQGKDLP